jgi:lysophospholipase L1-like esterase
MLPNAFIRGSGLFDGVEAFDAATLDPSAGNMQAEYLQNSTFTQLLPWDYLHPNHAGYTDIGEVVDSQPFAPSHHR